MLEICFTGQFLQNQMLKMALVSKIVMFDIFSFTAGRSQKLEFQRAKMVEGEHPDRTIENLMTKKRMRSNVSEPGKNYSHDNDVLQSVS